jgi:hypothetical protein
MDTSAMGLWWPAHLHRGKKAAGAAVRIMRGEAPGDIKTPTIGFSTPKFDWRADRFALALPP